MKKLKPYYPLAGALLLLLACYQLAFKKTLHAFAFRSQLRVELSRAAGLSALPVYDERKNLNLNLDLQLSRYQTDSAALRGNTIAAIASLAEKEGARLSEVPTQDPAYHTDHFIIQKLAFEGAYPALVRTLDRLEKNKGTGVPRSVNIKMQERTKNIVMEVLLEIKK